jgi:hypothetical protein
MADPEVWLRGPVEGVPAVLQPVSHSLLQCRLEVAAVMPGLSTSQLWLRPGGAASAGFHLRHAGGSLDRLFTYARGEALSAAQHDTLANEELVDPSAEAGRQLQTSFDAMVERAIAQLIATPQDSVLEPREVGRARLPSTVLGLLFHAAEHTQRHVGQLVTTARIVRAGGVQ